MRDKIKEWHNMVVTGLVNGLSRVQLKDDKRKKDIDFWRRRSELFDAFAHCVIDLETGQDWKYSEKSLKEWSSAGFNGNKKEATTN